MTPARHETEHTPDATPLAERPPTDEVALARGRVEQTPVTLIHWVAIGIGSVVVLVVAAYLVA